MTLGMGLIGAGGIAELHAQHMQEAGMELRGVCDVDIGRADKLATKYPGCKKTDSLDELLSDKQIQAVIVAVPNVYHAPTAIAALKAGKDVLLEKPMAMNVTECDQIITAAMASDRILQMGFVCRCYPCTVAAMNFIRAGRLGHIYHAKAAFRRRRGIPGLGGWFTTKSMSGGGPLIDLGVHVIDLAWHLAGHPAPERASGACYSVFGSPIEKYTYKDMWAGPPRPDGTFDVEDAATGMIRFEDGLTLQVDAVWAANMPDEVLKDGVMLWGDKGGMYLNHITGELRFIFEDCGHVVEVKPEYKEFIPWVEQLKRFRKAVETRETPDASADHGRMVQAMLDALYESSESGRETMVP